MMQREIFISKILANLAMVSKKKKSKGKNNKKGKKKKKGQTIRQNWKIHVKDHIHCF